MFCSLIKFGGTITRLKTFHRVRRIMYSYANVNYVDFIRKTERTLQISRFSRQFLRQRDNIISLISWRLSRDRNFCRAGHATIF